MIVPKMGTTRSAAKIDTGGARKGAAGAGLADALFPRVQQRVLGLLFAQPDRRFQSADLIRLAAGGTGAAHRQLTRLADVGLVTVARAGNQKYYQANRESPVFEELHRLVVKTVGLGDPLRQALQARARDIHAAFVYGSAARGADQGAGDIDLLVISDRLRHRDLQRALHKAEVALARTIHPTVLTVDQWRVRRARGDSFLARVAGQPRTFLIGSNDDLVSAR